MCDVEDVCTPAKRWNTYVTEVCLAKEQKQSRLWKKNPSESWQTQTLPRYFFAQVLPRSWHEWHQVFSGPEGSALQGQPSLVEMNLHGRKVCALFTASSTTEGPPSGSLTFTSLLPDASFQALLYFAYACIHKCTSAHRHSSLPLWTSVFNSKYRCVYVIFLTEISRPVVVFIQVASQKAARNFTVWNGLYQSVRCICKWALSMKQYLIQMVSAHAVFVDTRLNECAIY